MLRVADCRMMGYRFPDIGEEVFIHPNAKVVHSKDFRKPADDVEGLHGRHSEMHYRYKVAGNVRKARSSEWRRRK